MAEKLKFKLQSNPCLDPQGTVHAMVDIKLNDVIVAEDVQLDATIQTLTYDADITNNANNTISIQVTNAIAEDLNGSGIFDGDDETTTANWTGFEYSMDDGANWTVLLPQSEVTHTIPSGDNAGTEIVLDPEINSILVLENELQVVFNPSGSGDLINNASLTAHRVTIDDDGNYIDAEGNTLDN